MRGSVASKFQELNNQEKAWAIISAVQSEQYLPSSRGQGCHAGVQHSRNTSKLNWELLTGSRPTTVRSVHVHTKVHARSCSRWGHYRQLPVMTARTTTVSFLAFEFNPVLSEQLEELALDHLKSTFSTDYEVTRSLVWEHTAHAQPAGQRIRTTMAVLKRATQREKSCGQGSTSEQHVAKFPEDMHMQKTVIVHLNDFEGLAYLWLLVSGISVYCRIRMQLEQMVRIGLEWGLPSNFVVS